MDDYVLCGMQFGDEGKGTIVDYLAYEHNIDCVVKYNGGAQASHTVITPSGVLHKFSQLGSGMFLDKCHTYLSENMVINLDSLICEMEVFSKKIGKSLSHVMSRVHIHEDCYVVTPYHQLINQLRELSKGDNRRGSVGTGVSEVRYLLEESKSFSNGVLGLQVKDIFHLHTNIVIEKMQALHKYACNLYFENQDSIWQNVPNELEESLKNSIMALLSEDAYLNVASRFIAEFRDAPLNVNFIKCIFNSYDLSLRNDCESAIFEGSQGLLIDGHFGIKPNTTFLDTTNHFASKLFNDKDSVVKIGIAKAFNSRHGLGVFPTESRDVSKRICDENQEESFWNGKIRFGWFDAVLIRYAQSINRVDELYITALDKLDDFETIKICIEYYYFGSVDDDFKETFSYYSQPDGQIIITDIKKQSEKLGMYLKQCEPKYIEVKGWQQDISKCSKKEVLPEKCLAYLSLISELTNLHVNVVSVGPTRENKVRM